MKRFFKWAAAIGGITAGSVLTVRAIQKGRRRVKTALGQAEAIAGHTRAALEQTEGALREARTAI
jgi:hypothetical protein